jgi:tripartite-type tricarboxylate transporter receptor subunit TctC
MTRKRVLFLLACGAIAGVTAPDGARAQAYPTRAITMVVGFAPGGGTDIVARLVANKMSQGIGQSFVVTNVSGASGNIAAQQIAAAPPDGYRILFVSSAHSMNAALHASLPFDAVKDFAPITRIAESLNVIVVHPSLGVSTLAGLIELAKRSPGKLNYGSGGVGTNSHMSTELLRSMAGIDIVNVPYKGAAPLLLATLAGEVQIGIASLPTSLPHIRSGALKALAVTTLKRSGALPEVPTADEAGVRGYEYSVWYGLLAPAGTRADIVNRLRGEAVAALSAPEILERLKADGAEPVGSTPAEFTEFLKAEIAKWVQVVKKAGIKSN